MGPFGCTQDVIGPRSVPPGTGIEYIDSNAEGVPAVKTAPEPAGAYLIIYFQ